MILFRRYALILFLISLGKLALGQNLFQKRYDVDVNNEWGYISQLDVLSDSTYIFATSAYNNTNNSLLIGRLDKNGNPIWIKEFDDIYQISQATFTISQTNFLYFTYSSYDATLSAQVSVLVKMDLSGNFFWRRSYGQNLIDQYCERILITNSSIFLAGELYPAGTPDLYLLNVDTSGNFNWGKRYDTGIIDYLRDAQQLKNKDILLGGRAIDNSNQEWATVWRIDTLGNIIWEKEMHIPTYGEFNPQAIGEDWSGNLLISGHVDSIPGIGFGKWDISFVKLSSTGNFDWAKIWGGTDFDESWEVLPTHDKRYIVAAEPESFGSVSRISLMKIDSSGNLNWMRIYGKPSGGFPNDMAINADKGYSIFGADGDWQVMGAMFLIKTDSTGRTTCSDSIVTLPSHSFVPMFSSSSSTLALSGMANYSPTVSNHPLNPSDFCDFTPTSVKKLERLRTNCKVFPNPFSDKITISIADQNYKNHTIKIFNSLGVLVSQYDFDGVKPDELIFDLSLQAAGLYFVETSFDQIKNVYKVVKK